MTAPLPCTRGCEPQSTARAQECSPSTLAALICGLVTPFQISKPDVSVSKEPSPALLEVVDSLSGPGMKLARAQARAEITLPIQIDLRCALHATGCWYWMPAACALAWSLLTCALPFVCCLAVVMFNSKSRCSTASSSERAGLCAMSD